METCGEFRFLDLPPEIRTLIYKTLFVMPDSLYLYHNGERMEPLTPCPTHWLALLHANKQIHDEARSVLYGHNTFFLEAPNDFHPYLSQFLERIGSVNAGHLRKLSVDFLNVGGTTNQAGEEIYFEELKALRSCTNLEILATTTFGS